MRRRLHVHILSRAPLRAGDVFQPGRSQAETGLTIAADRLGFTSLRPSSMIFLLTNRSVSISECLRISSRRSKPRLSPRIKKTGHKNLPETHARTAILKAGRFRMLRLHVSRNRMTGLFVAVKEPSGRSANWEIRPATAR